MPTFEYTAMDSTGREVKDTIVAPTEDEAQVKIRQKGHFVKKLAARVDRKKAKKKKRKKGRQANVRKKSMTIGGVGPKALTTFTRQLSTLQDAGLPLLRSLNILEQQARPGPLKNSLIDTVDEIESGSTLSEAMAKNPKAFDRLYVNMVRAGEAGGALEVILQRLAEFQEKSQSLKRKVKGAMVYPILVITIAVCILVAIMIFVIPKFKEIFADFDIALPTATTILLETSDALVRNDVLPPVFGNFMIGNWIFIVLVPVVWMLFIRLVKIHRIGAFIVDWIKLRFPITGQIIRKTVVARTTRTLGTLVSSGVPILEGLMIARDTAGNAVFVRAYQRVYDSIREGDTIAAPLREARVVDEMVVNMIDVGEETGDLDTMLNKVADVYDEEINVAVEGLVSMLEPLMIVFLGGTIGFIVIALFMPLITIIDTLGK